MKKTKKVKPLAPVRILSYLCSVKRIAYKNPVDWMRGNLSGRQVLKYNGGNAYGIPTGSSVPADTYQPRVIAKVLREPYATRLRYYQVRTRTSVNMTDKMRLNLALMGGVGALLGSLLKMKSSAIYNACMAAKPGKVTLRAFLAPIIRDALANKEEYITIAPDVLIVNPWVSSDEPNVPVPAAIIAKFSSVLGIS